MRILVAAVAALAYVMSLAALVAWLPLTLLLLAFSWPFDPTRRIAGRFFHCMGVFWSHSFPFWRIRVEGRWPAGKDAYVVVANHQSYLDIFAMCNIHHEMKWVAKKELFKIPMFGWGLRLAGDISLERGNAESARMVMATARRYLAQGMSVSIFPEGTRSLDGKLLPFKPGAFKLAIQAGVSLLPVVVSGSGRGMPRGGPWVRPTRLTVRILDPVRTMGLRACDVRSLRDDVHDRMEAALYQIESRGQVSRGRASGAARQDGLGERHAVRVDGPVVPGQSTRSGDRARGPGPAALPLPDPILISSAPPRLPTEVRAEPVPRAPPATER